MIIPESEHITFNNNPLVEVICQVRFPPILRISSEPPVDFQEAIREQYPKFNRKEQVGLEIGGTAVQHGVIEYHFTSRDDQWTVTLTEGFLALACVSYTNWDDFFERLTLPLDALVHAYKPAFFSRVGLRYRNIIRKDELQIDEKVSWATLFNDYISAILLLEMMADNTFEYFTQVAFTINNTDDKVRMRYGIVEKDSEKAFLLDNDFFYEKEVDVNDRSILSRLNGYAGNLFRWCISETLRDKLDSA